MFEAVIDRLEVKKERREREGQRSPLSVQSACRVPHHGEICTPRHASNVSTSKLKVWLTLEVYY